MTDDCAEKLRGNLLDRWDMMANDTKGLLRDTESAFCNSVEAFRKHYPGWTRIEKDKAETYPKEYKDKLLIIRGDFSDPVVGYFDDMNKKFRYLCGMVVETTDVTHWADIIIPAAPEEK